MSRTLSRRTFTSFALAAAAIALVASAPRADAAGPNAKLDLTVVLASSVEGGGSVDPKIAKWGEIEQLKAKGFNRFEVLDQKRLPFDVKKPVFPTPYVLPENGPSFNATVFDVVVTKGQPTQYVIDAEMKSGAKTSTIRLTFVPPARALIGAPNYKNGKVWFVASVTQ
jgi:hypothetical protein